MFAFGLMLALFPCIWTQGNMLSPFEKEEWIERQVTKKKWPRPEAEEGWDQLVAENHRRDWKGRQGEIRLWLNKREFSIQSKEKYMDIAANTISEDIKNAKAEDVYALQMHVHDKAKTINTQHAFFQGGAGTPMAAAFHKQQGAGKAEGADGSGKKKDDGDDDDADCERVDLEPEPALKKLKGNIIKLRTNFNTVLENNMDKVLKSLKSVLKDLKDAEKTAAAAPPCAKQSDTKARELYQKEVSKFLDVVALCGATTSSPEPLKDMADDIENFSITPMADRDDGKEFTDDTIGVLDGPIPCKLFTMYSSALKFEPPQIHRTVS